MRPAGSCRPCNKLFRRENDHETLDRLALAALLGAALLPAAQAYDPKDHEYDDIMPAFGWEDEEWLDDGWTDNIMPAF